MPKIPRTTAKIFAKNAPEGSIGQFGSAITGAKVVTGNIEEIQALPAFEQGWKAAVISTNNYPALEEMNGVQKVASQQIAYLLQQGIPEYDPNTFYYRFSFCQYNGIIYRSLSDENINNQPDNSSQNWEVWSSGGSGSSITITYWDED